MTNDKMVKKVYECESIPIRLAERPKIRWENDIKEDLKIMKTYNWTKFIKDRFKWKEVLEKAKT